MSNHHLQELFPALTQDSITGRIYSGAAAPDQLAEIRLCSPFNVGADPLYYCASRRPLATMDAKLVHHERHNLAQDPFPRLIVDIAQVAQTSDEVIRGVRWVYVMTRRGK